MISASFVMATVYAEVHRLEAALEYEAAQALDEVSARVAETARATHTFQNRTGELEASIRPLDTTGSMLRNTLAGGVVADTDYAQYVEDRPGYEYLGISLGLVDVDPILQSHLEAAAVVAGWR